ncbi:hypothetical protein DPMN_014328 [Dreissena polymorpha]|uniref:Uncharacterized protein n=1 Tax=Dreissena polymorpha TaxID=45954 RepID=A0A9D4NAQ3_DREPO|nr:hypothetical protein DPMN_014328 [Dreissena polymorpha]
MLLPPLPRCSLPSSGDVVKPLTTYGQLSLRLATLPSSESQKERTSGTRDDVTRWINRTARRSSPIRPFSDDVVKPLSTYEQLPFRLAILRISLQ